MLCSIIDAGDHLKQFECRTVLIHCDAALESKHWH